MDSSIETLRMKNPDAEEGYIVDGHWFFSAGKPIKRATMVHPRAQAGASSQKRKADEDRLERLLRNRVDPNMSEANGGFFRVSGGVKPSTAEEEGLREFVMFTAAKHKERRRDARKNGPGGAYAGSAAGRQKIWDKSAARKKAAAEALVRLSNRDRRRRVRFGTNEYKFFDCTKPPNFVSAKMPKLKLKRRLLTPASAPASAPVAKLRRLEPAPAAEVEVPEPAYDPVDFDPSPSPQASGPADSPVHTVKRLKVGFRNTFMSIDVMDEWHRWRGMVYRDMKAASRQVVLDARKAYLASIKRGEVPDNRCNEAAVRDELVLWNLGPFDAEFRDAVFAAQRRVELADCDSESDESEYRATDDSDDGSDDGSDSDPDWTF